MFIGKNKKTLIKPLPPLFGELLL